MAQSAGDATDLRQELMDVERRAQELRQQIDQMDRNQVSQPGGGPSSSVHGEYCFASVAPSAVPLGRRSTIAAIPRSRSHAGHALGSRLTEPPRIRHSAVRRQRATSQQSAPAVAMGRSHSSRSDVSNSLNNSPVTPPHPATIGMMERFNHSVDEPANVQVYSSSMQRSGSSQRPVDLPSLAEDTLPDVGMDIGHFLASRGMLDGGLSLTPTMAAPPAIDFLSPLHSFRAGSKGQMPPTCPSLISDPTHSAAMATLGSGTPDCPSLGDSDPSATDTPNMSRQTSAIDNGPMASALYMARLRSTASQQHANGFLEQDALALSASPHAAHAKMALTGENLFAFAGAGLHLLPGDEYPATREIYIPPHVTSMERSITMDSDSSMSSYTERRTKDAREMLAAPQSASMERTISMTSNCSTGSALGRRAKEAREKVIENGMRTKILPKPQDVKKPSAPLEGPSRKEAKLSVPKGHQYTRPKHPKVFCKRCKEHPNGFRGEHELRRHMSAKHERFVMKWVCRDPVTIGLHSNIKAVNALSDCKACNSGKLYGAYYNAAAHLRRTHFKPKAPRGTKKKHGDDQHRGGNSAGDWPSMNDLKMWMEQVKVSLTDQELAKCDDDEAGDESFTYAAGDDGEEAIFDVADPYEKMDMVSSGYEDLSTDASSATDGMLLPTTAASMSAASYDYGFVAQSPAALIGSFDQNMPGYGSTVSSASTAYPPDMGHMQEELFI